MERIKETLIAVVGATGQQGGAIVRGLQARSQFKVRALSRNPDKHRALADEVVRADLNRPETLQAAFEGAYGVCNRSHDGADPNDSVHEECFHARRRLADFSVRSGIFQPRRTTLALNAYPRGENEYAQSI